jgi:hypothetical protein
MSLLSPCTIGLLMFVGFIVVGGGNLVVWLFIRIARWLSDIDFEREEKDVGVPPWLTGSFERVLAFGLLYFSVPDAGAILAGWIAAKLASNWQRRVLAPKRQREIRVHTLIALMAGTLSVSIGAAAGYIARIDPQSWTQLVAPWC